MTWNVERQGSAYRIRHVESGTVSYTDRNGRPYTRRTATQDAERYAFGGKKPFAKREKCPKCGGTLNRPNAMLPCTCNRSTAAE